MILLLGLISFIPTALAQETPPVITTAKPLICHNTEEILISQVFKEGEELNLEVSKNDEIFVTSGNMGLISIKVNNGQIKFLGSIGEIGRKQIF